MLKGAVVTKLDCSDERVLERPGMSEDAIIDMGGRALVAHCDPITGATWNLG